MKIGINKQLILEAGHIILEAVHRNHPRLDKSKLKDPSLDRYAKDNIKTNRYYLAKEIRENRQDRDKLRKGIPLKADSYGYYRAGIGETANRLDNYARTYSKSGAGELDGGDRTPEHLALGNFKHSKMIEANPRMISSARQ